MFCHICGNELPADAVFCNRCGRRIGMTGGPPGMNVTGGSQPFPPQSAPLASPEQQYLPTMPVSSPPQTRPLWSTQPTISPFLPGSPANVTPIPDSMIGFSVSPSQQPQVPPQASLPPLNAMQRFLVRLFQPAMASNALFGVLLGSLIAAVLGALFSWLLLTVAHAVAPHAGSYFEQSSEGGIDLAFGIFPLYSPWRDSLQLFLVMHGVPFQTQYQGGTNLYEYTSVAALSGLLVVPALLLTFAGYIAACTDMQNRLQSCLLRGAAIAVPYTMLLLLMMTQVNGLIPPAPGTSPSGTETLSMNGGLVLIFGLLWGGLFGTLGASLKLAQGQWRNMIRRYFMLTPHPQVTGMIVGGLSAAGLGLSLSLLVVFSFLALSSYSVPLLLARLCYPGSWQYLLSWGLSQGPLHAADLYFFSFGVPITIINPSQQGFSCFYTTGTQTVLTLRDTTLHFPPWLYAVLLLPVISLFYGGRTSVAVSRVQGAGPAAIQGALIAVPFTVLMILLSLITTITNTSTSSTIGSNTGVTTYVQSAGASAIDIVLWALLAGAILGVLGGIYEVSSLRTSVSQLLTAIGSALSLPIRPVFLLLDELTGANRSSRRTRARSLLYGAFTVALLLTIIALIAGGSLITLSQTISFQENQRVRDILSMLLITLPGLLLLSSCVSALTEDGVEENHYQNRVMVQPF